MVQYAVEVLDLVKRSLPVMVAATSAERAARGERDPSVYSDTRHLHYATLETEHPYKQAGVTHHKVGGWFPRMPIRCSPILLRLFPGFDLKVAGPNSQPLTAPAFVAMTTNESLAVEAWSSTLHVHVHV